MKDIDVRNAMLSRLAKQHVGDDDARIVQEMGVWNGTARVDIAVINGELCGFELKSDSDTLQRLPQQADIYGRVFDRMTLVVGERHLDKSVKIIPSWWGIIVATQKTRSLCLKSIKRTCKNPNQDPFVITRLLWREEILFILNKYNLADGVRSKTAHFLSERLIMNLPMQILKDEVRNTLKSRNGWRS